MNLQEQEQELFGLTIAEYFRDGDGKGKGKDVLFFVDNIFRFTQMDLRFQTARKNAISCRISTNISN